MTLRTIIIDDEPLARDGIRLRLKSEHDFQIIGEYGSAPKALEAIEEFSPDLIFLDIQMPTMNGFDLLKKLSPDKYPFIIFVTAFDRYALDAFRVHAIDYLLKPLDDTQFHQALERVRVQFKQARLSQFAEQVQRLLQHGAPGAVSSQTERRADTPSRIAVKSANRTYFVNVDEIDWIEAGGDYLYLHVREEKHLIRETMSDLESKLDRAQFLRIHKSYLINLSRIKELTTATHGDHWVHLTDGTKLRLSRSRAQAFQLATGTTL